MNQTNFAMPAVPFLILHPGKGVATCTHPGANVVQWKREDSASLFLPAVAGRRSVSGLSRKL